MCAKAELVSSPKVKRNRLPVSLTTQKQLRQIRDPGFCYICGKRWVKSERMNRDHVPPRKLFAEKDRNPPLILRTHVKCNNGHSPYDEQIAQAVSLLWKKQPRPKDIGSLQVSLHAPQGMEPFAAIERLNIRFIVAMPNKSNPVLRMLRVK